MCEIKVYVEKENKENLLLEDVILLEVAKNKIFLKNIFGEKKEFTGSIKKIDMSEHKLILQET